MAPEPSSLGGYFPLTVIRSLIFGDDALESQPILSKASNDFAKVIKLPTGIGLYLRSLDPNEDLFHIEVFTSHVEVWLPFEWIESSARYTKVRANLAQEKAIRDKHNARMSAMMAKMPSGLCPADKAHLAETILAEMNYARFDKVLEYLNVAELYKTYEEEDKATITSNQIEQGGQEVMQEGLQGVCSEPQEVGQAHTNEVESQDQGDQS